MKFLISGVIIFFAFILGIFGFAQIVGTLKYFKTFRPAGAFFTIILWSIILSLGAFVVLKWFNSYSIALYIGYGISFILSLGTKPD